MLLRKSTPQKGGAEDGLYTPPVGYLVEALLATASGLGRCATPEDLSVDDGQAYPGRRGPSAGLDALCGPSGAICRQHCTSFCPLAVQRPHRPTRIWAAYIQAVLAEWEAVTLVLDTTVLWGRLCWVRVSLVYRGRALPVAWRMLPHRSARVSFSVYRSVLEPAARMLPSHVRVLFLADRGFGDTALMAWLKIGAGRGGFASKGPCGSIILARAGGRCGPWRRGEVGPFVCMGSWWETRTSGDRCICRGLAPAGLRMADGGRPLAVEFNAAGPPGPGPVGPGPGGCNAVPGGPGGGDGGTVEQQARRQVDPHWDRGLSYLKIGWRYVKRSLVHPALTLIQRLLLPSGPDPCPAIASRAQAERKNRPPTFSTVVSSTPRVLSANEGSCLSPGSGAEREGGGVGGRGGMD